MIQINKIYICCDYKAKKSKNIILKILKEMKLNFEDLVFSEKFIYDFNNPAKSLCKKVLKNKNNYGILICESGVGMNIQSNRICGIRSLLGIDVSTIKLAREVEDINVLCLKGSMQNKVKYEKLIKVFFKTNFSNEKRHIKRIELLDKK